MVGTPTHARTTTTTTRDTQEAAAAAGPTEQSTATTTTTSRQRPALTGLPLLAEQTHNSPSSSMRIDSAKNSRPTSSSSSTTSRPPSGSNGATDLAGISTACSASALRHQCGQASSCRGRTCPTSWWGGFGCLPWQRQLYLFSAFGVGSPLQVSVLRCLVSLSAHLPQRRHQRKVLPVNIRT